MTTIDIMPGNTPTPDPVPIAQENITVAVYPSHTEAEHGVKILQNAGFNMTKLSIIAKDIHTEEHIVGYYNVGDRMLSWGSTGAFWGGLWGLLFGGAFFLIPGIGPIVMAGPLVAALVGALEGAIVVGGLSALGGALVSMGVPRDSALKYQTEIEAGKYLLLVHGTSDEVSRARMLLDDTNHLGVTNHIADTTSAVVTDREVM